MLQHFIGWEVQAKPGSFDDSKAILMDFRCDQSHGMHFIYCLPFSDSQALVESTVFSPNIEQDEFYEGAISTWLSDCARVGQFKVLRREKGAIPLGLMRRHDQNFQGIGGNCGAIRPSSGYAFSFIHKQIRKAIKSFEESKKLIFVSPHKKIDLWMDRIFLSVLRHQPQYAPRIFSALAKSLTGDEFAKFLSGEASSKMRLKVIFAMPVRPFIIALTRPERRA
jgi:lycopene beta-cyclase